MGHVDPNSLMARFPESIFALFCGAFFLYTGYSLWTGDLVYNGTSYAGTLPSFALTFSAAAVLLIGFLRLIGYLQRQ